MPYKTVGTKDGTQTTLQINQSRTAAANEPMTSPPFDGFSSSRMGRSVCKATCPPWTNFWIRTTSFRPQGILRLARRPKRLGFSSTAGKGFRQLLGGPTTRGMPRDVSRCTETRVLGRRCMARFERNSFWESGSSVRERSWSQFVHRMLMPAQRGVL